MIGIEIGSALFSDYTADGFLGIQYDAKGEAASGVVPFETLHPHGFAARAQDPTDSAATVFVLDDGGEGFTLLYNDPRAARLIPELNKGSSVQYAVVDGFGLCSFDLHDGADGTKTVYIEYLDGETKKAHSLIMGKDGAGVPFIGLVHGDGMGVTMFERVALLRNAPGSVYVSVDDDGAIINGNTTVNGSLKVTGGINADGDVKANASVAPVSLMTHPHPTAMGPSGPPTPTP